MGGLRNWWGRLSRRGKVVVVAVAVVVLAAFGAAGGSGNTATPSASPGQAGGSSAPVAAAATQAEAATPAPTPTPPAVTPVAATPAPAPTPAPAATPKTLLAVTGNGIKTTKSFGASGDSVDVTYAFNCSNFGTSGNFQIMFYGASALGPSMPDILTNELALKGSDTTTEYLNGSTGPFHMMINSECAWTVKVVGTP